MKKIVTIAVRVVISAGLLTYLFLSVPLDQLGGTLAEIDIAYFVIYILLGFFTIGVSTWKWALLCYAIGMRSSLPRLYGMYLSGIFYSQFLPTSVGGDVIRGIELHDAESAELASCYATIFVERFTGISVLVVFVITVLPLDARLYTNALVLIATAVMVTAYGIGTWLVFHTPTLAWLKSRMRWKPVRSILEKATRFQEALRYYRGNRKTILLSLILSAVFYLLTVAVTAVGLKALHQDVAYHNILIAVPIMLMLFLLPISLGGIGLQEWSHAFVMSLIGLSPAAGVALGLLFRIRMIILGLLGGVVTVVKSSSVLARSVSVNAPPLPGGTANDRPRKKNRRGKAIN